MKRLPALSLRIRLVLWTVALEAILLLLLAGLFFVIVQRLQNQEITNMLRLGASQLSAATEVTSGQYVVEPEDKAVLAAEGVLAWVLNPDHTVMQTIGAAQSVPLPNPLPPINEFRTMILSDGAAVRLFVAALHGESQPLGTLVVALPLSKSQNFQRQILLNLSIVIPIMLLLSIIGGLFLAKRALAPISAITQTARHISVADLSQRLQLNLPNDELGRLAHTFNAMLDRLDRAFQREQQLTADVAHELRTPLALLKTQVSLARSRPRPVAVLLEMMTDMEGDVDRMTRLVEQILTLARVEQNALSAHKPVALDEMVRDLMEQFYLFAEQQGITLKLELTTQADLSLQGDSEQLRQVFANLIENAIKYTKAGGTVTVSGKQSDHQLTISVRDSGVGIPAEHLPYLFDRFYRVDSARTLSGFGLGLAIAQAIIQAHGGQIMVSSAVNLGTTFTVMLPIQE